MIRVVGLSATLPNYHDVATFLNVNPTTGVLILHEELSRKHVFHNGHVILLTMLCCAVLTFVFSAEGCMITHLPANLSNA